MSGLDTHEIATLGHTDPDRYLSTLYAPAGLRDDLATLYLVNVELASIRDRIHDPMPGEIRIQWWRDAVASGEGGGHPLVDALVGVIKRRKLPVDAFDRYFEARIFDLYDDAMPSRSDLEGYLGDTASALIQLAGLVLAPDAARGFAAAAGHAGCAQGIAGLLRLLPLHLRRGQCYVPAEILAAAGTDREGFLAGADKAATRRVVDAMVALGRDHADRFEDAARGMPAALWSAYLPASLSRAYLGQAAQLGERATATSADIGVVRRHVTMLHRALRGW